MSLKKTAPFEKYIYLSVPLVVVIAGVLWTVKDLWEAFPAVLPVNRSIWELLKIPVYSVLAVWIFAYFARYKLELHRSDIITGAAVSIVATPFCMVVLYYSYICAFGIHSGFINFLIFVLAIIAGQFLAHHICTYLNPTRQYQAMAFGVIVFMMVLTCVCTYHPPKLPIFMDPENGSYGIYRVMD